MCPLFVQSVAKLDLAKSLEILASAGECDIQRPLQRFTNVDIRHNLARGESIGKVGQSLAIAGDVFASETEGNDAIFAGGLFLHGGKDGSLRNVGTHRDVVDAWVE